MHMSDTTPLISCICITRAKPHLLRRAISCYEAQTYGNRELVILYEDDDEATAAFLETAHLPEMVSIMKVAANPKQKLGTLRNMAVEAARGTFICQWDDDDWCHSGRLEQQYAALKNTHFQASLLTQWIVYDDTRNDAYISNTRLWEGSILCNKEVMLQKRYEQVARGEDTAVIDHLKSKDYICEINGKAGLYIYIYHGSNTWHAAHWNAIFDHSKQLSVSQAALIRSILDGELSNREGSRLIDELFVTLNRNVNSNAQLPLI